MGPLWDLFNAGWTLPADGETTELVDHEEREAPQLAIEDGEADDDDDDGGELVGDDGYDDESCTTTVPEQTPDEVSGVVELDTAPPDDSQDAHHQPEMYLEPEYPNELDDALLKSVNCPPSAPEHVVADPDPDTPKEATAEGPAAASSSGSMMPPPAPMKGRSAGRSSRPAWLS